MKRAILIFFFSFVLYWPVFLFAQQISVPEFYKNFSDTEKRLFDSLPDLTKQKLNSLYNMVKQQNLSKASSTSVNLYSNSVQSQAPLQTYSPTNPGIVPITSFTPPRQQAQNPYTLPENNPYYGTAFEKYYADSQFKYGADPNGGFSQSYTPLTTEEMKNLPKLGSQNADCSNFGVNGNMNGTSEILRMDTNRLCISFGKKIKVVDAKRGGDCRSGAQHNCGRAMDVDVNSFGDKKTRVLLVLAFICSGYNVGSYEKGFPAHFDHEFPTGSTCSSDGKAWKTWSRWAHTNGKAPLPYEDYVRDAMSLMGFQAKSSTEFRQNPGCPTKAVMAQKAKEALVKIDPTYSGLCFPQGKI